jgi:hypothetical protein
MTEAGAGMAQPGHNGVDPQRPGDSRGLPWLVAAVAGLCLVGLLLLPHACQVREPEGWERSASKLRYIAVALERYHDQFGRLPPAAVCDEEGTPLYSWRVVLLPFLEEEIVYRRFHLDEPWDGSHNKELLEKTPRCYAAGGGDPAGLTRYQALVGPDAAFAAGEGRRMPDDFPDGLADTLLVAEAAEPVPWTKPVDLPHDAHGPLPRLGGACTKPVRWLGIETGRVPGFCAVFADGKARFVPASVGERTLRGFITRNGGEKLNWSELK